MPFFISSEMTTERMDPSAERTIKTRGGSLMASEMHFMPGGVGAMHSHPHEQIIYIIEGELDFTSAGETHRVRAGDSLYVPGDIVHGCVSVTESRVLDIFTPQRLDFLD